MFNSYVPNDQRIIFCVVKPPLINHQVLPLGSQGHLIQLNPTKEATEAAPKNGLAEVGRPLNLVNKAGDGNPTIYEHIFTIKLLKKKISSKAGSVPPTAYGKAIFHTIAKELLRVQLGTTPEWQNSLTD